MERSFLPHKPKVSAQPASVIVFAPAAQRGLALCTASTICSFVNSLWMRSPVFALPQTW